MSVIALPAFQDNYIWAITDEVNRTFTCVDPGDAEPVLAFANTSGFALSHILITHHHHDHMGGLQDLLRAFPNAHAHAPDDLRIQKPYTAATTKEPIIIGPDVFQVLNTSGHTASHISYYEPHHHWLFCGDTLFSAGCGRVFDGTMEALHASLLLLKNLPDETAVYCGHEYTRQNLDFAATIEPDNLDISRYAAMLASNPTQISLPSTIALEKRINPFFRTDANSIKKYAQSHGLAALDSFSIFKQLRDKKNKFV